MTTTLEKHTRIIKAKRDGWCSNCGTAFKQGDMFKWQYFQRRGYCITCEPIDKIGPMKVQTRPDITEAKLVSTPSAPSYLVKDLAEIFDGRFTIPFKRKDMEMRRHITLWIKTRSKNNRYPGQRRIRVFHGRENENKDNYVDVAYITVDGKLHFLDFEGPTFSHLKAEATRYAVQLFVKAPMEKQLEFGMYEAKLSQNCWRCGRLLTNPDTLELTSGCGPICDKKVGSVIDITKTKQPEIEVFPL